MSNSRSSDRTHAAFAPHRNFLERQTPILTPVSAACLQLHNASPISHLYPISWRK